MTSCLTTSFDIQRVSKKGRGPQPHYSHPQRYHKQLATSAGQKNLRRPTAYYTTERGLDSIMPLKPDVHEPANPQLPAVSSLDRPNRRDSSMSIMTPRTVLILLEPQQNGLV